MTRFLGGTEQAALTWSFGRCGDKAPHVVNGPIMHFKHRFMLTTYMQTHCMASLRGNETSFYAETTPAGWPGDLISHWNTASSSKTAWLTRPLLSRILRHVAVKRISNDVSDFIFPLFSPSKCLLSFVGDLLVWNLEPRVLYSCKHTTMGYRYKQLHDETTCLDPQTGREPHVYPSVC